MVGTYIQVVPEYKGRGRSPGHTSEETLDLWNIVSQTPNHCPALFCGQYPIVSRGPNSAVDSKAIKSELKGIFFNDH